MKGTAGRIPEWHPDRRGEAEDDPTSDDPRCARRWVEEQDRPRWRWGVEGQIASAPQSFGSYAVRVIRRVLLLDLHNVKDTARVGSAGAVEALWKLWDGGIGSRSTRRATTLVTRATVVGISGAPRGSWVTRARPRWWPRQRLPVQAWLEPRPVGQPIATRSAARSHRSTSR